MTTLPRRSPSVNACGAVTRPALKAKPKNTPYRTLRFKTLIPYCGTVGAETGACFAPELL